MTLDLSEICRRATVPVENHVWQSTLFSLVIASLTILLRNNAARYRFAVWFVASAKFLIPFWLLTHLGSLAKLHASTRAPGNLIAVVQFASTPFGRPANYQLVQPDRWGQLLSNLPMFIGIAWATGAMVVSLMWGFRWLEVWRLKNRAKPMPQGAETSALRSLIRLVNTGDVQVYLSRGRLEPGVFGVFRPALLWPEKMSAELSNSELNAILAHELWHVRRHDNLLAAVQMIVEALFWFHPLVWWFGSRQLEERERACDEGVLGLGGAPAAYAEGILKTCKFCVEAPLPCVAGVNGANLKKRITRIMNQKRITTLSRTKKFVFSSLAVASIIGPFLVGMASSRASAQANAAATSSGALHITTLRPNVTGSPVTGIQHTASGTSISNTTVRNLIEMAYGMKTYQLTGGPAWINQDRFDITYRGGEPTGNSQGLVSNATLKEILAEQFHLVLRQDTKPGSVFALVVGDGGAKLVAGTPRNAPGTDEPLLSMRVLEKDGQGEISIMGGPGGLAESLSSQVGRPVVDKTGLTGIYNINFHWVTASASADTISSDLQQQLGLALVPQEGLVESSVIVSIAKPDEISMLQPVPVGVTFDILSDTKGAQLDSYLGKLAPELQRTFLRNVAPVGAAALTREQVSLVLTVDSQGQLSTLRLAPGTEESPVARAAWAAVRDTKFAPLPISLDGSTLSLRVHIGAV